MISKDEYVLNRVKHAVDFSTAKQLKMLIKQWECDYDMKKEYAPEDLCESEDTAANQNGYVGIPFVSFIPFLLNDGFRSHLEWKPIWNKTTQERAEEYLSNLHKKEEEE